MIALPCLKVVTEQMAQEYTSRTQMAVRLVWRYEDATIVLKRT